MVTDIKEFAKTAKPSVAVVGLGGAGCNITTWIAEKGMAGGRIIAANTDANHLHIQKADKLVLLGERLCKGHGCGGFPEKGAQATRDNLSDLRTELEGTNLVFLVAGLGGGTGTGAMPVAAELTRELGILTVGCVTIPFTIEMSRREKARESIQLLAQSCDSVVIIDNSKLREVAGNLPLKEALNVANALVGAFVKNLTDTITQPSLVNLDYADLRAVMERGGVSSIGIGESVGENRVEKAVAQAISTPLLDVRDVSASYGVLVHIIGGEDLTLEEVAVAGELIMDKVPNTKRIIWGAKVDHSLTGAVRVMAVLTGVESPFISGEIEVKEKAVAIEAVEEVKPEPVRQDVEPPQPEPAVKVKEPEQDIKKEEEKTGNSYIWIGLILLVIFILLWYFMQ
ncbi:cell division protein FtsZ [Candidatus Methanoperedens nitroreducens]|uniref:Cell division protein FtsZ n=1 Tax=Candidatus Methanoperedens nitratireducens TaxID=1392998 RepID=A0A062UTT6_9EURY|nr:cell division protein FtsZ [Candidatus Methanoperedens nitroreducens]KCZ70426.1 cell division protein FtsZ [Candidatus Methanoperedens nitroreducens]MDJ1420865.1 cell division protein FtsZ [Candidatus Methanoperedens sp.]